MHRTIATIVGFIFCVGVACAGPTPSTDELIRVAVGELLKMQEKGGEWPYEGVYRVGGEIPIGYRIAGTAIVSEALHFAAPENTDVPPAIERGIAFILEGLENKGMTPKTPIEYDVRIWGFTWALDLFCQLRHDNALGKHKTEVEKWIPKLIDAILVDEIPGGGWNYASRSTAAPFVTAPVVQTLLVARGQGESIPDDVLERARKVLTASRYDDGAFTYSGLVSKRRVSSRPTSTRAADSRPADAGASASRPTSAPVDTAKRDAQPTSGPVTSAPATGFVPVAGRVSIDQLPGSCARSAVCESTLLLLGEGSPERVKSSLDAFHAHWGELEKRRKKTGTHTGTYAIAPYFFYYGHRYAAQAIQMLPEAERARERERLLEVFMRTRDEDGTWNDRVFPRSRNFGTAMIVIGLLGDKMPMPPKFVPKR